LEDASKPVSFGQNQSVSVSASIGVTVFPDDASVADTLLHHADQGMYEAKRLGKRSFLLVSTQVIGFELPKN
jgi:GGDEF domain-containing protein